MKVHALSPNLYCLINLSLQELGLPAVGHFPLRQTVPEVLVVFDGDRFRTFSSSIALRNQAQMFLYILQDSRLVMIAQE